MPSLDLLSDSGRIEIDHADGLTRILGPVHRGRVERCRVGNPNLVHLAPEHCPAHRNVVNGIAVRDAPLAVATGLTNFCEEPLGVVLIVRNLRRLRLRRVLGLRLLLRLLVGLDVVPAQSSRNLIDGSTQLLTLFPRWRRLALAVDIA